ncbi:hypothetical protein SAY86_025682 [Trapa natans]|uniref:Uncharacterized protein n=1 Tax=Trapa natans TaxID=22666 RepID=A0AAN7KEG5_TRANT|nr:hypothetical protein SAY86_025682 [Trapa natans]
MRNLSRQHHHHMHRCLCCHPRSYIRLVQHLIERCLILRLSQDQCVKVLAERAGIQPLVTLTGFTYRHTLYRPYLILCGCIIFQFFFLIWKLPMHVLFGRINAFAVWRGLLKENRDFFQAYFLAISHQSSESSILGLLGRLQEEDNGDQREGTHPGH